MDEQPDEWDELVAVALVGTSRRGGGDPARLLERAARLTVARRGGELATRAVPPDPCQDDPRPQVSPAAASRLAAMLAGDRSALLPEWLAAAVQRERRLPDHLLPALLDQATTTPRMRPLVARAGGPRARWLAKLNPSWAFGEFGDAGDDTPWRLGTLAERRVHLGVVRAADRARARDLLIDTKLTAAERAAFLPVLADGLALTDEPLLESALDDRAEQVRVQAADLLALLPGSAFQQRMTARARQSVRREPAMRGVRIVITPPEPAPRDQITGSTLARVTELAARTPPSAWQDILRGTPGQILSADLDEWEQPLIAGWVRAACAHQDGSWTLALADRLLHARRAGRAAQPLHTQARAPHPLEALHTLLNSTAVPWSGELTRLVLGSGAPAGIIAMAAHRGDTELGARPPADDEPEPLRILRFRHDMLKELDD